MGYRIEVSSELAKGTTFSVLLPLETMPTPQPPQGAAVRGSASAAAVPAGPLPVK